MTPFRRLGDRVLIALDGTEDFCSQKLGCARCLTRKRSNGKVESYHAMALPLMPDFIAPQDGAGKQDCERNAVRRWLAAPGDRVKHLWPVLLGDDLFACQPVVDAMVSSCAADSWSSPARAEAAVERTAPQSDRTKPG